MSQKEDDAIMSPLSVPTTNLPTPTSTTTETATKKRKGERKPSDMWIHFTKFVDEEGNKKAKCNYCSKSYFSHSKKNGTSTLKAHFSVCKAKPNESDVRQSQLSLHPIPEEGESDNKAVLGNLTTWKFDQENCRLKLVEMVIRDELPFSIVDGEGFNEFVHALQPKFKIPSRFTISRDIYKMFMSEKLSLKQFFRKTKQSVCITTDTWTSLQRLNYMCITAHFIDEDWNLNKKIINFCTIESHKGEIIGRQVDACLREWGISRVCSVTVDNASSNDVLVSTLKNKLLARGSCLGGGKFLHMRCIAHIVNLVVQDGLKELNPSIKKIRDAVRFVRHSPARIVRFKECCIEEKIESKSLLCLDVPTRWNSTYSMLETACKFEKAFDLFEVRDPYYKSELDETPECVDWENGRKMSKVLQTFFELTNRISGSLYVTSNVFFNEISNMLCLLKEWVTGSTSDVRPMGQKMKAKFDKYWGDPRKMNNSIFFAVVVDLRFKFKFLLFTLVESYGNEVGTMMANSVKDELYALYDEYKVLYQPSSGETTQSSQSLDCGATPYIMVDKFQKQQLLEGDELANDLDVFLNEKERTVPNVINFDVLSWWKVNEPRLPILAKLARDILAVPVSTVASESAFSTGGRVLDPFRSSLSPSIVESLICTQDWLKKSKGRITIEEDLESIQKHEEALKNLGIDDGANANMET